MAGNDRRSMMLWGLFGLQAFCAVYFVGDALIDIFGLEASAGMPESDALEYAVSLALVLGVLFTGSELLRMRRRERDLTRQIRIASGAFEAVLERQFEAWKLTPAEREVAILSLKGCSLAEMAAIRETREGTVKAQCAALYRKAGVSGRLQLLSSFLEDLMSESLMAEPPAAAPTRKPG